MEFKIVEKTLIDILDYLYLRPFGEVNNLINALKDCQIINAKNEAVKPEKVETKKKK